LYWYGYSCTGIQYKCRQTCTICLPHCRYNCTIVFAYRYRYSGTTHRPDCWPLLGVQNCTRTSVQVYRCRWTTPVLRCYNSFSPLVLAAEFQVQSFWYWCSAKYLQDNFPPPRPLQRTHYPLSTKRGKGEERTAVLKLLYTHCAFEFASASRNLLVLSIFSHCTASHTSVRSASATCLRLSLQVAVVPA